MDWGRLAAGAGTLGLSELVGYDNFKNKLFGGEYSKGMPQGPQSADMQRNYLQGMLGRQAPTMSTGQADQSRGQQQQLANMLFQTAQGRRAGAGELAVNRQANQALAQQTAQAQMARGANSALAARNAARNSADIGTNAAGQAAIAQLQDQQAATNQLGGLLGQTRAQDIGVAQGNQQAQMQQQQLQISALAQMLGVDEATLRQDLAARGFKMGDQGMLPSLLQVGGTALGAMAAGPAGAQVGGQLGGAAGGAQTQGLGNNLINPYKSGY